jgi:hypothetical protein
MAFHVTKNNNKKTHKSEVAFKESKLFFANKKAEQLFGFFIL